MCDRASWKTNTYHFRCFYKKLDDVHLRRSECKIIKGSRNMLNMNSRLWSIIDRVLGLEMPYTSGFLANLSVEDIDVAVNCAVNRCQCMRVEFEKLSHSRHLGSSDWQYIMTWFPNFVSRDRAVISFSTLNKLQAKFIYFVEDWLPSLLFALSVSRWRLITFVTVRIERLWLILA